MGLRWVPGFPRILGGWVLKSTLPPRPPPPPVTEHIPAPDTFACPTLPLVEESAACGALREAQVHATGSQRRAHRSTAPFFFRLQSTATYEGLAFWDMGGIYSAAAVCYANAAMFLKV